MGYYDGPGQVQEQQKKKSSFLPSLFGAIIGGIIVLLVLYVINGDALFNSTIEQSNDPLINEVGDESKTTEKMISVDIVTEVTEAIDKTSDAVVGITNLQTVRFWNDFDTREAGTGSGVVYKKEKDKAFIVTNHHVVEGATELEVTLSDGTKTPARFLGSDVWTDLAVLEIDGEHVTKTATFGDSDSLKVGEPVIAIGNPLGLMFASSVTQGIISGLERTIPVDINNDGIVDWNAEVIQTDAAINPGNSGGALVNLAGQVIGINSMKIAEQAVEGIGLSIPINSVIPVINDLELHGVVKRAYLGINLESVANIPAYYQLEGLKLPAEITSGVAITKVVSDSPAARAGLREYDVIVQLDDKEIGDVLDLRKHLYNKKQAGDEMKVIYYRDGQKEETVVKLTTGEV